ncbi:hypothetical protein B5X24_HaOG208248 [Helicoverpa armigera]|uniref:Uncharacterized protein n=1 Tax=Helicoverpa armigera TaxID=29058 RepID=A0A2W1BMS3_HELAM|nr:hypothetical protein B5X24_HaOG208248 [Helicoverpa armigera]
MSCLKSHLISRAFPQLCWGWIPVQPDAAEYQCFTKSDCLADVLNPATRQLNTPCPERMANHCVMFEGQAIISANIMT